MFQYPQNANKTENHEKEYDKMAKSAINYAKMAFFLKKR